MKRWRTPALWPGTLPLVSALYFIGVGTATAEGYTPPAPLSSVDALANPQQDNGYGLGALIASQQAQANREREIRPDPTQPHTDPASAPVSAATAAARQARAARKQVAELQTLLKQLNAELATRVARQQAADEKFDQLQAKLLEQENAPSQAQKLAEADAQLSEKDHQLRLQQRQLDAVQAQLALTGDNRKALDERTAALARLQQQMASTQRERDENRSQLTATQTSLTALQAKAAQQASDLTTPAAKQDYVVGQSIAASLRDRLQSYGAVGLALNRQQVLAGISDGLAGTMQLKKAEMDTIYRKFATALQQQVNQRMLEGQKLIAKKSQGQVPARQIEGITYFVEKKGKTITDPDAPVMLSLTENIMDGRTLSKIPRLVLTATDEMPSVIREALPLLGEGSEIQAYALAKSVYGERPLPQGVEAFTVLSYQLKGLPSTKVKSKSK